MFVVKGMFWVERKWNERQNGESSKVVTLGMLQAALIANRATALELVKGDIGEAAREVKAIVYSSFQDVERKTMELIGLQQRLTDSIGQLTAAVEARHNLDMERYRLHLESRKKKNGDPSVQG